MKKISLMLALILVIALPGIAGAWTQEFMNDYANTDAIYLWMNTPGVSFGTTAFGGGHIDWQLAVDQPTQQFMYGPAKPGGTGGIFVTVNAPQTDPFSFEWAEVNWSGGTYILLGSGTASWSGGGWSFPSTFNHSGDIVPIPLPASVLLLGTGILGLTLLGFRRRRS